MLRSKAAEESFRYLLTLKKSWIKHLGKNQERTGFSPEHVLALRVRTGPSFKSHNHRNPDEGNNIELEAI